MKKLILALFAVAATAAIAADTETTTTTTTSTTVGTGTITEYSPGTSVVVKESSGPVTYKYGDSVTYVTKSGKKLTEAQVKSRVKVGTPVSVHYTTKGETRVVDSVEVDDMEDAVEDAAEAREEAAEAREEAAD